MTIFGIFGIILLVWALLLIVASFATPLKGLLTTLFIWQMLLACLVIWALIGPGLVVHR